MGLACSKEIACKLGGDIMIKHSEPSLTIFCFKIPVNMVHLEEIEYTWKYSDGRDQSVESIGNDLLRNYAKASRLKYIKQMKFSEDYFNIEARKRQLKLNNNN